MEKINLMENLTTQDKQAVAAVRSGDAGRYRELVERHERRVYAVAWSRLGDATLAEEATQEAFIRAYRRLWLLGDGAKFTGWITAIARRVSINLGLRHRRELNKRERWALEQTDVSPAPQDAQDECAPETLRQTLEELPAAHRECLVLFYLENKSGAEAALALGISETALRVRLHRARAALRERLEEKLADSLGKLRPGKTLVSAIMAVILASSTTKATAGTGATVVGTLVKFAPVKWVFAFIPVLGMLPGMGGAWWLSRMERRNYREGDGFRARLHLGFFRSFLFGYPVLAILTALIVGGAISAWGFKGMVFIIVTPLIVMVALSARLFVINQNRYCRVLFNYNVLVIVIFLAIGFGLLPVSAIMLVQVFVGLGTIIVIKDRPIRMDYNLFLRAAQGMLPELVETGGGWREKMSRQDLKDFARFLGERWLVNNFRWKREGLVLRMPTVKPAFLSSVFSMFYTRGSRSSCLTLGFDGTVKAHCSEADVRGMAGLATRDTIPPRRENSDNTRGELEGRVAGVVLGAWECFRRADRAGADRAVGQTPEGDIFVVPVARARSTLWWRWLMIGCMVLLVVSMVMQMLRPKTSHMDLKPVSVSEAEVHRTLAALATGVRDRSDTIYGLQINYVLPRKTNDFTPAAWQAVRDHFLKQFSAPTTKPKDKVDRLMGWQALQNAVGQGWFTAEDLGLTAKDIRRCTTHPDEWHRTFWLEPYLGEVQGESYKILDLRQFVVRMECLQQLQCLDVLDGRKIVTTVRQQQMFSSATPPGYRQVAFPEQWHGLFLTLGDDPIIETYDALRVLELFGALNLIDHQACVEGLLRFHRGKGIFASKKQDDGLAIFGDSRDTIAGFESLRMLGALNQVKDLDKWQFRPFHTSNPRLNGLREVTWSEMEAWLCQQRLDEFLRERKANPRVIARSLLGP